MMQVISYTADFSLTDVRLDLVLYVKPCSAFYEDKRLKKIVQNMAAEGSMELSFLKEETNEFVMFPAT